MEQNVCGCSAGPSFEPFQDGGGGGLGGALGIFFLNFFDFGWNAGLLGHILGYSGLLGIILGDPGLLGPILAYSWLLGPLLA